jgi:hypothetical protein
MTDANAERSTSANLAPDDYNAEIERRTNERKAVFQAKADALRTELAQVEEEICRLDGILEAAQGRKVTATSRKVKDPIKSARAYWAQSIRRKMPKPEQHRRKLVYETLIHNQIRTELTTKNKRLPTAEEMENAMKNFLREKK